MRSVFKAHKAMLNVPTRMGRKEPFHDANEAGAQERAQEEEIHEGFNGFERCRGILGSNGIRSGSADAAPGDGTVHPQ
jgi:hypothetical protein